MNTNQAYVEACNLAGFSKLQTKDESGSNNSYLFNHDTGSGLVNIDIKANKIYQTLEDYFCNVAYCAGSIDEAI